MTCRHCLLARAQPDTASLDAGCYGCQLREVARGQAFFKARKAKFRLHECDSLLLGICGSREKADEAWTHIQNVLWPAIRAARAMTNNPMRKAA